MLHQPLIASRNKVKEHIGLLVPCPLVPCLLGPLVSWSTGPFGPVVRCCFFPLCKLGGHMVHCFYPPLGRGSSFLWKTGV